LFILRNVCADDLEDLYELSGKVQFINLPHDKEIIKNKIKKSVKTFITPSSELENNVYFFVLEDLETQKVIGVSMIHAQHGTEKEPHFYLKVGSEHKFSQTINTGFVHGTLKLGLETNGPTEIGGLVVNPHYRGHPDKLGKQIAFVRFLYMSMFPERFKETVHSELMPPLEKDGSSPLWEAIGRRFINMDYQQADILSRNNKEFILSLFPSENIYMTLLSPSARDAIGKVGKQTEPIKNMLEKVGFKYISEVDPFDGGPHYRAKLKETTLFKNLRKSKLVSNVDHFEERDALVHIENAKFNFFALKTKIKCNFESNKMGFIGEEALKFNIPQGTIITYIPF
jgi:arginine N-succinyltransferase